MQRNFYERLGLDITLDEGKVRFVNRVNDLIFTVIEDSPFFYSDYSYSKIYRYICKKLGRELSKYKINTHGLGIKYHGLDKITGNDFIVTLHILEKLSDICKKGKLDDEIKDILSLSIIDDGIDLGIRYHSGLFYLSGDKELDEEIIETSLDNIKGFKAESDYIKVLKRYLGGDLHGTLSGCFTTLETLSQEILGNDKGFKANKTEILKYFGGSEGFSKQWLGNINLLYDYLNDYSERHNGDERDNIDELEVEATLYQLGLIINLLIHKYNSLGKQ